MAHPDDAELMCYGTLCRFRRLGVAVTVVIATNGVNGVSLTDRDRVRLGEQERLAESAVSFADTGIEVVCLGLSDGALRADRELISRIESELVRLGCTMLLTHSQHSGNDHQDHLAVAKAASNAATRVPSCTAILHGEPHAPRNTFRPNVLVDVTDVLADKVKALQAHQTQGGRWYLSEEYTRHRAAEAGWSLTPARAAHGRYFEAFEASLITLLGPED
ncbi:MULTISPECIES: PIG-L deacetylase family protein [Kitasatospora]|uniref:PIG-L deacetylase family protein n=1 Tax=Kitasatospora cystarginea TaxID=58350 RepID=UPI0031E3E30F